MIKNTVVTTLVFASMVGTANAEIHKCITAKNKVIYTEEPCSSGTKEIGIELIDNATDSRAARKEIANRRSQAYEQAESVANTEYMSQYDINNRIRELQTSIKAMTATEEKIAASQYEMAVLTSRTPKKLSFDDETKRNGLRKDLGSIQQAVRQRALNEISSIIQKY